MKILPIGCGSAMCLENFQSNYIIEHNGKRLLLDAGDDTRFALKAAGLKIADLVNGTCKTCKGNKIIANGKVIKLANGKAR